MGKITRTSTKLPPVSGLFVAKVNSVYKNGLRTFND